jgi:hypothetical protein
LKTIRILKLTLTTTCNKFLDILAAIVLIVSVYNPLVNTFLDFMP